jgi:hypothetical protein
MGLIAVAYGVAATRLGEVPAAGNLLGHAMGIIGFLMMLMTETLYSLRKRSRSARWGRTSNWLQFHIFTGLVGPFLVLLHTSWRFNGLAGIVALMMGIVVFSGFVGRYIYTAVPRTADGIEVEAADLESQISATEADLQRRLETSGETIRSLVEGMDRQRDGPSEGSMLVLGRLPADLGHQLRWWRLQRQLTASQRRQARELNRLLRRSRTLHRQVQSLVLARRMLAVWRSAHIPIGVALFVAALFHIGGAIYYATLLR